MKAILIRQFGGPEVLQLEELPTPKPATGQVLVQAYESILHHVLRLVGGKPQAYKVAKQGLAQFAVQGRSLARVRSQARERQRQWDRFTTHSFLCIAPLCI